MRGGIRFLLVRPYRTELSHDAVGEDHCSVVLLPGGSHGLCGSFTGFRREREIRCQQKYPLVLLSLSKARTVVRWKSPPSRQEHAGWEEQGAPECTDAHARPGLQRSG